MDPGDSAAWTAAIVAICAAVLSAGATVIAWHQAKSARSQADTAKRSADISEEALAQSKAQTRTAKKSAQAAESQAAEARRQNEITEQQLEIMREQLKAEQQRHYQEKASRHVRNVRAALIAADDVLDELRHNAAQIVEYQNRSDPYAMPLILFGRAKVAWDKAVEPIRIDRPAAPQVNAAIGIYDDLIRSLTQAVDNADDLATSGQLRQSQIVDLHTKLRDLQQRYDELKLACTDFFTQNGVNPDDLATSEMET